MTTNKLYWHFVRQDGRLAHPMTEDVVVTPGLRLEVPGDIELYVRGLHASARALDALLYARGPVACLVRLGGKKMIEGVGVVVANEREVVAMVDAALILHEFALWCAERALSTTARADPRSIEALDVKRLWMAGKASDEELAAAEAAAWAAAWDATRAATAGKTAGDAVARDVAWTAAAAAAGDAPWAAAGNAAGTSTGAIVRATSGAVPWDADWDAAWASAWASAWAAANQHLEALLFAAPHSLPA